MTPGLVVTIDTEEEGLWGGEFRAQGNTVLNTAGIPRFQELCDRHGVLPSYLVDTPVVEDDRSVEMLGAFLRDGRCEVGAHLHPWCAPPFEETPDARNSFQCNLPEELQREKLRRLTEGVEGRFGRRPTSFRAGRYGLDIVGARILEELGYEVDSSVIAFEDFSGEGGPDFSVAPWTPYPVGGDDLLVPVTEGGLLEVPVSVAIGSDRFERRQAWRLRLSVRPWRWLRLVGLLDRAGALRRTKLSPEQAGSGDMCRLVDSYLDQGAPCVVMLFHSSSLVPGLSPYVPDEEALERFHADLDAVFHHCRVRRGMTAPTLTEFARSYRARVGSPG